MFKSLGDNSQGEDLSTRHSLVTSRAVREHTRKLRYFGQPAPVFLQLGFDSEVHSITNFEEIKREFYSPVSQDAQRQASPGAGAQCAPGIEQRRCSALRWTLGLATAI